jgi:DNA invertase Pin-like site-specific DNA recombinase
MGRRVLCLYRVSTDGQVTYNDSNDADIPMQRRECRRFLERQGWVLVHEEREDGVSGHKVRAEKRDSIQNIKELATTGKFDIFLVFMFDRIGRIADETPFVVEWLVKSGVRVWSTQEGEQRFDSHTDKLMNYIRFWQADGESEKTSIRTKAGLSLLVEEGHYKGGSPPFGYQLIKSGRIDKKGNEKKNLAVIEEEAVIVRKIFDLYVRHGYGTRRITTELTKEGIKTRTGKNFSNSTINNIIHNLTYTGVLRSGETRSNVIDELQIVPEEVFEMAQDIMKKRSTDAADARTYPMNTESRCLLTGKVYCADCGSRLIMTTTDRFVIIDGVKVRRLRYTCYHKYAKLADCQGQTGYSSMRLDNVVDGVIRHFFEKMQSIPKSEVVTSSLVAMRHEQSIRYKTAQRDYAKTETDLAELKSEVIKSIRGESKFTADLLSELIAQTEKNLSEFEVIRDSAKRELDECESRIEEMKARYDEVISWTELYDAADLSAKKMIVANLINRIEVGVDYQLHIDLNIDLTHFGIQLEFCSFGHRKTA